MERQPAAGTAGRMGDRSRLPREQGTAPDRRREQSAAESTAGVGIVAGRCAERPGAEPVLPHRGYQPDFHAVHADHGAGQAAAFAVSAIHGRHRFPHPAGELELSLVHAGGEQALLARAAGAGGFTGGKLLDDASQTVSFLGAAGAKQDYYNRQGDKSISAQDVSRRLVISFNYDIPIGRHRALLNALPKAVDFVLGGWQINGIFSAQTGLPFASATAATTWASATPDSVRITTARRPRRRARSISG